MMTMTSAAAHRIAPALDELAFHAFHAPVVPAAQIVAEFPTQPLVSWSSNDLTIVGIGIAREIRGTGSMRWRELIDASVTLPARVEIEGVATTVDALGFARPRFIGGAAFAPGAASQTPWIGFGDAWFVLPRWTYVSNGMRAMLVLATDAASAIDAAREHALLKAAIGTAIAIREQPPLVSTSPASAHEWSSQVTDITDAIGRGDCSKIVAARTCDVELACDVDAATMLAALDERHRDCVRVLVRPPGAGTLIAATPERLVRRDGRAVYCDALAGTINAAMPDAAEHLLASAKDRREHDLVVQAIRASFEDIGTIVERGPYVRALRHVMHLHTSFNVMLRESRHILELVARLHPTPAVGGTPTAKAVEWIASHEPVARGWYASPVGWFDLDGNGEIAVAIRSGVLAGNRAHLWAGAGIVAGSDPDRELAETDAKFRAMLGALGVS